MKSMKYYLVMGHLVKNQKMVHKLLFSILLLRVKVVMGLQYLHLPVVLLIKIKQHRLYLLALLYLLRLQQSMSFKLPQMVVTLNLQTQLNTLLLDSTQHSTEQSQQETMNQSYKLYILTLKVYQLLGVRNWIHLSLAQFL